MNKRLLPLLLLLGATAVVAADPELDIYRTVDEDGNVIYTDTPPSDDAEPVELDPLTTVPAVEASRPAGDDAEEAAPEHPGYAGVGIVYPAADETIRHNGGQVPFRLALRPEGVGLAPGHEVVIVLDGEPRGHAASLQVTVGPVDRGPHTALARVVDADGTTLASSTPVDFFLLRHSIQSP